MISRGSIAKSAVSPVPGRTVSEVRKIWKVLDHRGGLAAPYLLNRFDSKLRSAAQIQQAGQATRLKILLRICCKRSCAAVGLGCQREQESNWKRSYTRSCHGGPLQSAARSLFQIKFNYLDRNGILQLEIAYHKAMSPQGSSSNSRDTGGANLPPACAPPATVSSAARAAFARRRSRREDIPSINAKRRVWLLRWQYSTAGRHRQCRWLKE
jgi:hypothetical protein